MLAYAIDASEALAVFFFCDPMTAEDDVGCVTALLELEASCSPGLTPAIIVVNQCKDAMEDVGAAAWLRALAQETKVSWLMAIVTPSARVLSVLKAVTWLLKSRHSIAPVSTFDEAVLWVERCRGSVLPSLHELHREVRLEVKGYETVRPTN
jgi:hypothetical protein